MPKPPDIHPPDNHYWTFRPPGLEKRVVRAPKDVARDVVDRLRACGYAEHPWEEFLADDVVELQNPGALADAATEAHRERVEQIEKAVEHEVSTPLHTTWVRRYADAKVEQDAVACVLRDLERHGREAAARAGTSVHFDM